MEPKREDGLLRWQWALYEEGHRDRGNLVVHALTAPLFVVGTVALPLVVVRPLVAAAGLAAMVLAVALQGRGHKRERSAPRPFRGPLDVAARIFVEQWVTFPRYLLSGGFARALRRDQ